MLSHNDRLVLHKLLSKVSVAFADAANELLNDPTSNPRNGDMYSREMICEDEGDKESVSFKDEEDKVTEKIETKEHIIEKTDRIENDVASRHVDSDEDEDNDDVSSNHSNESGQDYHNMTRSQLQDICKTKNLRATGKTWELIQRIIESETIKPKYPIQAFEAFTLLSFDRKSNSNNFWNAKCHSGKFMHVYLYACQNEPTSKKYLHGVCRCGKQCLRAWALGNVSLSQDDPLTIHFFAADTNGHWINYPCEFKAGFMNESDVKRFKQVFEEMSEPFNFEPPDDDFLFQSQTF